MKKNFIPLIIAVSLTIVAYENFCQKRCSTSTEFLNREQSEKLIAAEPCTKNELEEEIAIKLLRVENFLVAENLRGILLTTTRNFSWITAGIADNHIDLSSETGPASLLILKGGKKYLIADNAETPHLMEEDLVGLGYEARQYMWNEDRKLEFVYDLAGGAAIGTDYPLGDLKMVEESFAELRYLFTPSEVKKFRWLSNNTAEAVASVCRILEPGMSDRYIESLASDALLKRGIRPTVILIGLDDRIEKYCHFPPVGRKLEKYAFVNVCAKRWGMVTSVGRYVYFGDLPEELRNSVRASAFICANMIHATKSGAAASDIFEQTKSWYAQTGYPGEWKNIHCGGAIGYLNREWVATPENKNIVNDPQAFAWNPFVSASLSFHTIISSADGNEIVTAIEGWPVIDIEIEGTYYAMPDILVKNLKIK